MKVPTHEDILMFYNDISFSHWFPDEKGNNNDTCLEVRMKDISIQLIQEWANNYVEQTCACNKRS